MFTQDGAQVTAFDGASLTAYGATVGLDWEQGAHGCTSLALGQALIPLVGQAAPAHPASVASALFQPSVQRLDRAAPGRCRLAVTAPAQLGAVTTAGLLALRLGAGLAATWPGATGAGRAGRRVPVRRGRRADPARPQSTCPARPAWRCSLWTNAPPSTARSSADVTIPGGALLYYASIASYAGVSGAEVIAAGALTVTHIDRPVAADGSLVVGPDMPGMLPIYQIYEASAVLIAGEQPDTGQAEPLALALRNSLLVTSPPAALLIACSFSATPAKPDSGGLLLAFRLRTLLPTLPDPYAANFLPQLPGKDEAESATVTATVSSGLVSAAELSLGVTALGEQGVPVTPLPATPRPAPAGPTGAEDQRLRENMRALFSKAMEDGSGPALFLLDVSGNVDQFGRRGPPGPGRPGAKTQAASLSISGLDLVAPCLDLRVFTAPARAVGAVVTIHNLDAQAYPFPLPAGFLYDGGPTLLGAADVTLVPVAPWRRCSTR